MTVIAYRNAKGEFTRCGETSCDEETLQIAIDKYNLEHPDNIAEFFTLEDGSFEHFLWRRYREKMKLNKETLLDLRHAVEEVEDLVYDLFLQCEENQHD